ncbi:MAG: RNA methyltransferase [Clostridiales bacterium]|nr:RNA methyltransferase [Clostridiales bacterium]
MEIITSAQNQWVAEARKLQQKKFREERGLFLAEGLRLAEEAAKAGSVQEVYYHETFGDTDRGAELLKALSAETRRFFQVTAKVLNSLAETETPQGIVCVCGQRRLSIRDFAPERGVVVLADGIQDPGNLGSVLRTLWAAGGSGLICLAGTTDPFNGKCVRASMGGIYRLPVFTDMTWSGAARWALDHGYTTVAAEAGGGVDYRQMKWPDKTLLCIGNEARGLLSVVAEEVGERVFIPLAEEAESLNAAVAAGILIFSSMN